MVIKEEKGGEEKSILYSFLKFYILLFFFFIKVSTVFSSNLQIDSIKGVLKEEFPLQSFYIHEDFESNIWHSSEFGINRFDRLRTEKINQFEDKPDVLKIFNYNGIVYFFHQNFDITLYQNNKYNYIKFGQNPLLSEIFTHHLLDIKLNEFTGDLTLIIKSQSDLEPKLKIINISIKTNEVQLLSEFACNKYDEYYSLSLFKDSIIINGYNKKKINKSRYLFYSESKQIQSIPNELINKTYVIKLANYEVTFENNKLIAKDISNQSEYLLLFEGVFSNIIEDYEGNIWISTQNNGVWFFELNLIEKAIIKISDLDYGKGIYIDKKGNFLFSKKYGFYISHMNFFGLIAIYEEGSIKLINNKDTIAIGYAAIKTKQIKYNLKSKINDFCITHQYIYLGLKDGLYRFSLRNRTIQKISVLNVNSITSNSDDDWVYFTNNYSIYSINQKGDLLLLKSFKEKILTITVIQDRIYYSTNNGVYQLDEFNNNKKCSHLKQIKYLFSVQNKLFMADNRSIYISNLTHNLKSTKAILMIKMKYAEIDSSDVLNSRTLSFYTHLKTNYNKNGKITYYIITSNDTISKGNPNQGWVTIGNLKSGLYNLIVQGENDIGIKTNIITYKFSVPLLFNETVLFKVIFLISVSLSTLIIIITFRLYQRKKLQKVELIIENENFKLQLLKSQLNPHFLFNSLNSLKSLIYFEKYTTANTYIDKLSLFLRDVLLSGTILESYISSEIKIIENYLELENFRLNGKINYLIDFDDSLSNIKIPSNILQPIIENSIKYGNIDNKVLIINIRISKLDSNLRIAIKDNGPGISKKFDHKSFSLKSIEKRLLAYSKNKNLRPIIVENVIENNKIVGVITEICIPITY